MKLPDHDDFNYKDCTVCGDECVLITPKDMSVKWGDDNARFRSTLLRKSDGFVISQGFGKFTNFGERPDFQPWDPSWKFEARHKLDGSLLIVSKYKGEFIVRTRGTVDARQLPNGAEIDGLIEKYPLHRAFANEEDSAFSLLFEWTTPSNVIVLREHNEPTLTLLGIVNNQTGLYLSQEFVDGFAVLLEVARPHKYEYNSVEECILDVDAWRGKEGVVLYSPDGQTLKKIKAAEYCELHKIATGMKTTKQVLDVFLASPRFETFDGFYRYIETTLDYEIAERIREDIESVVRAYCNYLTKLRALTEFVNSLRFGESRKDQAAAITGRFKDWRRSFAFLLLDEREIPEKAERDAMAAELEALEGGAP